MHQVDTIHQSMELALEIEKLDQDLYRSVRLWRPISGRGAFGGQIIGQAAWAATQTVDTSKYHLHSLHCYFLSFGNVEFPVIYHIDRIREGRSYITRSVKAVQNGKAIFTMGCSFQLLEPRQPTFQRPFPTPAQSEVPSSPEPLDAYPDPETCYPLEKRIQQIVDDNPEMSSRMKQYLQRTIQERSYSGIEIRTAIPPSENMRITRGAPDPPSATQAIWFRSRSTLENDPAFQRCVIAYASDFQFIGTAGRALGLGPRTDPKLGMMASLDHSIWFYNENLNAAEWMLYHMDCVAAGHGRGFVNGRIFAHSGKLVAAVAQEGVVRAAETVIAKL